MRLFIILAVCISRLVPSAHAQETIKVATRAPQGTPVALALQAFSDMLQSCTNDSIEVEAFTGGIWGSQADIANSLHSDSLDMAILPASALEQFSSATSILSAPLVFNNRRHWETALDGPVIETLNSDLAEVAGLRVLGFMGGEQYGILSKSPITNPEDIKGRSIRTVEADFSTFEALGANPAPIAFAEVYSALQTGLVDSTEATLDFVLQTKAYEAATEFTTTNHRIFTDLVVMNLASFEKLSDDERICLSEAVEIASEVGRNAVVTLEQEALAQLAGLDINVREIENRQSLFEMTDTVTSTLVARLGADEIYKLILSSVTCPTWCNDSRCEDNECKICRVCE